MFPRLPSVYKALSLLLVFIVFLFIVFVDFHNSHKGLTDTRILSKALILPDPVPTPLGLDPGWPKLTGNVSLDPSKPEVLNPFNFTYVINPQDKCANKTLFLLIYVHSTPSNFRRRQMLRQTWCSPATLLQLEAEVIFVMGSVPNDNVMRNVRLESERYGDIVQEDYLDSYRNLTYKGISALKWVSSHCQNVSFILKTDDDIMVHIYNLVQLLHSNKHGRTNIILCNQWTRMKVLRDKKSKWYIPEDLFEPEYFPPYCSGSAFVLTPDAAVNMYAVSKFVPFFWVDDYYITGMLVKRAGVTQKRLNDAYILNSKIVMEKFKSDNQGKILFYHVSKQNHIYKMWKLLKLRMNVTSEEFRWAPSNKTG